jgi:hypothetical protein
MNLYEQGDFVSQADRRYCVPASIQTMLNIVGPHEDRSPKLQARLYALARKLSPPTLRGDGAEPEGWARTLDRLGVGPYVVDVQPSRAAALETAARAIRLTRRPVGLLVWRGAHAWVMSGFVASADPAVTDEFSVTHVFLQDVWYPRVSSIWGASRPPNSRVRVELLREDFLPWRRPHGRYPDKDGRYVLIVPTSAEPVAGADG